MAESQDNPRNEGLTGTSADESELFRIAPVPLFFTSMDGTIVDVNLAGEALLNIPRDRLIGTIAWSHSTPVEYESVEDAIDLDATLTAWTSRQSFRNIDLSVRRNDGSVRRTRSNFEPVSYRGIDGMLIAAIDITEREATASALVRSQEALRLQQRALAATSSGMVIFDAKATGRPIVSINPAYARMLGVPEADVIGQTLDQFADAFIVPASRSTLTALIDTRRERTGTLLHTARNGESFVTEARFAPVLDQEGTRSHQVGVLQDVTERVRAEAELRLRSLLLDEAPAAILAITTGGLITHWNAQAEKLLGWPRSDAIGAHLSDFSGTSSFHLLARSMLDRAIAGERWEGEAQLVDADGRIVEMQATSTPIPALGSRGPGMVAVMVDITDRKHAELELQRLAVTDPLTGLANRARFVERLQVTLAALEPEQQASVFFVNVDQVRAINESLGHEHGDRALQETARRLRAVVGTAGLVARFSDDTFSVIVETCSSGEVDRVANAMHASLQRPLELLDRDRFVGGHIGYTLAGPGQSVSAILSEADTAQREARLRRPSEPVAFRAEMAAQAQRRLDLETDLRHAVQEGQFQILYQPIVSLSARTIVSCEALIRWVRPDGTVVLPGEFIPLAEEMGLIIPIGQWVLEEVCRTIQCWIGALGDRVPPEVHINISPDQFRQPDFARTIRETLDRFRLSPRRIWLELTETMAMTDAEQSLRQSRALREIDVRLAMDDFGAGYANLGLLNKLPVQMLKIDQSFAAELETEPGIQVITRSLIQIGRDLGMVVTGEGIETAEQADRLASLGANRGQGYFFARPMSERALLELLMAGPSLRLPR
jgi:diguanylate cyclase (GGDEF)-like protein/PAS domain S-box-containing protein